MQDTGFRPEWRLAFIARIMRLVQVATPTGVPDSRTRNARRNADLSPRSAQLRPARP